MYWRGPIRVEGGGGGAYRKVEGVSRWRGCIMQSGGGLKVVGVYFILTGEVCRACIIFAHEGN